jgi:undecaprenyl-diphosphatase
MSVWHGILLAIVEGLTEYLPVSSTGHLVITSAFLGIENLQIVKHYEIIVQFGAILAVVFEYFRLLRSRFSFYPILFVGFLPAAVIGLAVKSYIDALLGHVLMVALALVVGGVVLLFTDRFFEKQKKPVKELTAVTWKESLQVGFFQCLAFFPGVSRSGASIWGGAFAGMDKKTATEFSFLLAVPTLTAATMYKLYKAWPQLSADDLFIFLLGNVISFVIGWLAIRLFIRFVVTFGFKIFGIYRIFFGSLVAVLWWVGFLG